MTERGWAHGVAAGRAGGAALLMLLLATGCSSSTSYDCVDITLVLFDEPIAVSGTYSIVASGSHEEVACHAVLGRGHLDAFELTCPSEESVLIIDRCDDHLCPLAGLRLPRSLGDPIDITIERDGAIVAEETARPVLDRVSSGGCEIWEAEVAVPASLHE